MLKLQCFGRVMQRADPLEKNLMLERLKAKGSKGRQQVGGEPQGGEGSKEGQGLVTEHLRCAGHSKAGEVEEEGTLGPAPACARSEEDACLPAPAGGGAAARRGGLRVREGLRVAPRPGGVWGRRARARAARSGLSCRPTLCYPSGCPARTEWAHRTLALGA